MAKIIFTSRYLKGSEKKSIGSFINYIATRDGVDTSVNIVWADDPASEKQKSKIDELLELAPDMKITFEYEDYVKNPTKKNASELITKTTEDNIDLFSNTGDFINYMALRPRAEKISEHGLFSAADSPINLEKVKSEVANHKGRIYTNVISLRREDAERLGYNNADAWRVLVNSKQEAIAKNMNIPIKDLRWYAAFHNESHHPHIHLLVYNAKPRDEFLGKHNIENLRSAFANDIFRDELVHIYAEKSQTRDILRKEAREKVKSIVDEINSGAFSNPALEELLLQLSEKLQHTTEKKSYGYLKADGKRLVDEIVKQLASDDRISELYNHWCDLQDDVIATYKSNFLEHPPLWEQKEFKSIKNAVINEALNLVDSRILIDEPDTYEYEDAEPELPPAPADDGSENETEFLQQMNDYNNRQPSTVTSAVNLIRHLSRIISDDYNRKDSKFIKTDKKVLQKIREKKEALGIKME